MKVRSTFKYDQRPLTLLIKIHSVLVCERKQERSTDRRDTKDKLVIVIVDSTMVFVDQNSQVGE